MNPFSPQLTDRLRGYGPYALILGFCLFAFLPTLGTIFAITDDYVYLWSSLNESATGIGNNFVWSLGRVLWALAYPYLFALAGSVEGLFWIRLAAVLLNVALGSVFYYALRRAGVHPMNALAGTVLICLSPVSGLIVSWTAAFNIVLANTLAVWTGLAFYYLWHGTTSMKLRTVILSAALIDVFALMTLYQTSSGFFPLIVMVLSWREIERGWRHCQPTVAAFAVFTLSSAIYTLFYWKWVVPNWGYAFYTDAAQFSLSLEKLALIWNQVVYTPLSGWLWSFGAIPGAVGFMLQAGLVLLGLAMLFTGDLAIIARRLLAVLLAAGPSVGAITLIGYQPAQALLPVYGFFAVLTVFGLEVLRRHKIGLLNGAQRSYAAIMIVGLPVSTAFVINQNLIRPSAYEYQWIRQEVKAAVAEGIPEKLSFLASPMVSMEGLEHRIKTRGSGPYSTSFGWTIDPAWNLVLNEIEPDWTKRWQEESTQLFLSPNPEAEGREIHIFSAIEGSDFPVVEDPHFGEVREIRFGWYFSEWFGYFQRYDPHWIYHPSLGHTAVLNRENNTIYFQSGDIVWACIIENYPFIVVDDEWYYLDLSTYHWGGTYIFHAETGAPRILQER